MGREFKHEISTASDKKLTSLIQTIGKEIEKRSRSLTPKLKITPTAKTLRELFPIAADQRDEIDNVTFRLEGITESLLALGETQNFNIRRLTGIAYLLEDQIKRLVEISEMLVSSGEV